MAVAALMMLKNMFNVEFFLKKETFFYFRVGFFGL